MLINKHMGTPLNVFLCSQLTWRSCSWIYRINIIPYQKYRRHVATRSAQLEEYDLNAAFTTQYINVIWSSNNAREPIYWYQFKTTCSVIESGNPNKLMSNLQSISPDAKPTVTYAYWTISCLNLRGLIRNSDIINVTSAYDAIYIYTRSHTVTAFYYNKVDKIHR